jgi:hypothetical protein
VPERAGDDFDGEALSAVALVAVATAMPRQATARGKRRRTCTAMGPLLL